MCRSIQTLRRPEPVSEDEIEAASRQFVRKISGFRVPSRRNHDAFEGAIAEITDASRRLLENVGARVA